MKIFGLFAKAFFFLEKYFVEFQKRDSNGETGYLYVCLFRSSRFSSPSLLRTSKISMGGNFDRGLFSFSRKLP